MDSTGSVLSRLLRRRNSPPGRSTFIKFVRSRIQLRQKIQTARIHYSSSRGQRPNQGITSFDDKAEAETAFKLLADGDYHFEMTETWVSKQKTLEEALRTEGPAGLAKVVGHLYVMIKRDAVPPSDVVRFFENVYKIFARELADSLGLRPRKSSQSLQSSEDKLSYDN